MGGGVLKITLSTSPSVIDYLPRFPDHPPLPLGKWIQVRTYGPNGPVEPTPVMFVYLAKTPKSLFTYPGTLSQLINDLNADYISFSESGDVALIQEPLTGEDYHRVAPLHDQGIKYLDSLLSDPKQFPTASRYVTFPAPFYVMPLNLDSRNPSFVHSNFWWASPQPGPDNTMVMPNPFDPDLLAKYGVTLPADLGEVDGTNPPNLPTSSSMVAFGQNTNETITDLLTANDVVEALKDTPADPAAPAPAPSSQPAPSGQSPSASPVSPQQISHSRLVALLQELIRDFLASQ